MTRLIDADAINPMRVPQSVKEMRAWIDSQPTVDAIPIEWMRKWWDSPVSEASMETCNACEGDIIEWMIREWAERKEI